MDWMWWTQHVLHDVLALRRNLGADAVREVERTPLGKRQSLFEKEVVQSVLAGLPSGAVLHAEGYDIIGPDDSEWTVGLDPVDGTAGDARFGGVGCLASGLPVSSVLAIRRTSPHPTFGSMKYAGILNLRDGQIFWASSDAAFEARDGKTRRLARSAQHNRHAPAIACEIARRANAFLRFLIPYGPLYPEIYSDSNSSAIAMLWALTGYCDLWWNANLPGIAGAGQRGHELGAIAVFARALGAYAVTTAARNGQVVVEGPLDGAPYTFDGQTSVILGVDEKIVSHYLGLVNASLAKQVTVWSKGGQRITTSVGSLIAQLYDWYPDERWSLPLVHDVPAHSA